MKKLLITIALCYCVILANAQPPNNPIFYGGYGDGISQNNYIQTSTSNQLGGDGDGIASNSYMQSSTNIQLGGDGDGWHKSNYAQLADAFLFLGGDGDGITMQTYESNPDQAIFFGGDGDGWSSIVYPLGPLPLTLLSFKGEEKDGQHILHWQTSNEQNTSHFVIEHSSDAQLFKELGMTNAAGNSQEEKTYRFTNKTPIKGNNFYRLKMVDIDGKFTYSNVVLLNVIDNLTSISLYPNPTANILNVEIHNQSNPSQINIRISDLTGKIVWISDKTNLENKYQIDISSFASGMYFLIVEIQNNKQIIKFRRL